jgi:hypothetical protein
MTRFALVIPAFNEAACLPLVLSEWLPWVREREGVIALGLNGTTDHSSKVLQAFPEVVVGTVVERGYGHGCVAAMEALQRGGHEVDAYVFISADGAHDPTALPLLLAGYEQGCDLVLGQRTLRWSNLTTMGAVRVLSNLLLGAWAGLLSGRSYADLGPYRLISARLMQQWELLGRDMTWGWTIEPQVLAPGLKMRCHTLSVVERRRIAGEQKVTGVSLGLTWQIAQRIFMAGWRMKQKLQYARASNIMGGIEG